LSSLLQKPCNKFSFSANYTCLQRDSNGRDAINAIAVNHDFVPLHVIALGKQVGNRAAIPSRRRVACTARRRRSGDDAWRSSHNEAERLQARYAAPVLPRQAAGECGKLSLSQPLHLSSRLLADGLRRQWLSRRVDYFLDGHLVSGIL
jgi:hypothetical protein